MLCPIHESNTVAKK